MILLLLLPNDYNDACVEIPPLKSDPFQHLCSRSRRKKNMIWHYWLEMHISVHALSNTIEQDVFQSLTWRTAFYSVYMIYWSTKSRQCRKRGKNESPGHLIAHINVWTRLSLTGRMKSPARSLEWDSASLHCSEQRDSGMRLTAIVHATLRQGSGSGARSMSHDAFGLVRIEAKSIFNNTTTVSLISITQGTWTLHRVQLDNRTNRGRPWWFTWMVQTSCQAFCPGGHPRTHTRLVKLSHWQLRTHN